MKVLVTGWFSFEEMGATAGDLMARDIVCEWLDHAKYPYEIALAPPFKGGVDWQEVNPDDYSHVVFVCGPFGNGPPITEFLPRFANCRLIGVDLTMLESLDTWNPFDLLLERDSSTTSRPEISFASRQAHVPVVGLILIDTQPEYKKKDKRKVADNTIERLIASREMAIVRIDTRLDVNNTGLRSPSEVESLIARMDLVLTTRLHGMVLALKNGVPAVVIDSVAGGDKVKRQAETIGWDVIFTIDTINDEALQKAFDYCLTEDARIKARKCRDQAIKRIKEIQSQFINGLPRIT